MRGFSSALADDFFFRGWPPVVFFLIEKAAAFFLEFRFVAIIKNRPVRGGFLLQLDLRGPNSTLCRWYRTFFEILFQKCVVPDLCEILRRVPAWCGPKCGASSLDTPHQAPDSWYSVEVVRVVKRRVERFLSRLGGRRESLLGLSAGRFR